MIEDPLDAMVAFLKADTAVAADVGTRVFGIEVPDVTAKNWGIQAQLAVVVIPDGQPAFGPGIDDQIEVQTMNIDVRSYGPTMFEAAQLRLKVREALKNLSREVQLQTLIHSAKPAGGPVPLRDADRDWPFIQESFTVLASECQAI